ncbi:DUF2264 domain-containing protein, partial [uncultured Muribaculum sp.]
PDYQKSPYSGMTRAHWLKAAEYLLNGAFGYIHTLDDPMYFPKQLQKTYPNNDNDTRTAKLEGLARTLFVAAPLLKENPDLTLNGIRVADYYRHQLVSLSDSTSKHYIPHRTGGPSQTLLELGSLAISMKAAEEVLWDALTQKQKDDLAATMLSYGNGPSIGSNWMFFNVFIMSFMKEHGYEVNETQLKDFLEKLLARYRGEGWYNDAPAYDYYSMWAYQSYGPLWAVMWGDKQYPELARRFLANQNDMIDNYPYMFNRDGRMNMWGRSICYRFAAVTPLPLIEYGKHEGVNYGWLRRIASSTLLQFMQHPEFLENGVPTMGFYGPFAPAVQIYSCRGSVYWCGKAFLGLLLPEDSEYWSAVENNGPWESDLLPGKVYHKFQPATNLLITDYPNSGASEMRSWCHETVAADWQKFRSSENYNKLAYNTEFPWMADGDNGEVSMNYATKNRDNRWEVLRLYTFRSFDDDVYRRDAVLETDTTVRYQLADISLPDGILRIDKVSTGNPTQVRLGNYSLPQLDGDIKEMTRTLDKGYTASIIDNGDYQLATVALKGWKNGVKVQRPKGLHPVSSICAVPVTEADVNDSDIFVTLHLWKKSDNAFTDKELRPVKSVKISKDRKQVTVKLADGRTKTVNFN